MRLRRIFDLVDETDVFADIGCDHGKLCQMVVDSGKAKRVIATDISEACLKKARELLGNRAEYFLGDGLEPLGDLVPTTTVISGMGGNTVLHIIGDRILPKMILSPHNDVFKVRRELTARGYRIIADEVVFDSGKYYDILKLVRGKQRLNELQTYFGVFFDRGEQHFVERLRLEKQKIASYKPTQDNINKLRYIEEAESCLKSKIS